MAQDFVTDVLLCGDCVDIMDSFPADCVDLIICDPPYNLQVKNNLIRSDNGKKFNGVDDKWDDYPSFVAYDMFVQRLLNSTNHVLKPDGTIMIMGMYHNIFRIGTILQNMGYWILNDIIWEKTNPTPNFNGSRLCNSHETIIWASKSKKSKYFFNYHLLKHLNNGKQPRSDWTLPICSGKERILKEDGTKAHSTQKPLELMQKLVIMATRENDIVLDPMCGTGTALVASKMYNRQYVGIDIDPYSISISEKRLQDARVDKDFLDLEKYIHSLHKKLCVRFEKIVADGKVNIGTQLRFHISPEKPIDKYAIVESDGIKYNGEIMSIHKAAKMILNRESANGWKHWYFNDTERGYICIDDLRKEYNHDI